MPSCNGKTITDADIARSEANIKEAFAKIQAQGHLPSDYKLKIQQDPLAFASVNAELETVNASPVSLSCLTPKETMSVLLHETGHTHYPKPVYVDALILPQLAMALMTTYCTIRMLWPARKNSMPFARGAKIVAALFLAHTLNGQLFAEAGKEYELKADAYAARTMGTAEYRISSLKKYDGYTAFSGDRPEQKPSALKVAALLLALDVIYGPWGMFNTHPSNEERIKALQQQTIKLPDKPQNGPS